MPRKTLNPPAVVGDLVSYRIRLLQVAAWKQFESVLKDIGPAPRYLGLLGLIASNPGAAQSRLAEEVHLDRSSLVTILDMLESEGLVQRRRAASDRRVRRIFLTPAGHQMLDRLTPLVAAHEAALLAGLSASDREGLIAVLDQLGENLRQAKLVPTLPAEVAAE